MNYSPRDILNIVKEQGREADFFTSLTSHINNYTIAEITDCKYKEKDGKYFLMSQTYKLNIEITDDDILTALMNKLYVSAFISRFNDSYNIHFLVHRYPASMKPKFEEEIAGEVFDYMMLKTIITLRLDNPKKLEEYLG
ncbi:MAG: hypothetical protein UH963_09590 [Agathobacter sp.]|nr:hypothetical protein [Agathobacter sp.]